LLFAIRQKKNFICEVPSAGIHGSVIRWNSADVSGKSFF
jgi:hypothetical protein